MTEIRYSPWLREKSKVPVDVVGTLCADVLAEAVVRAIRAAKGAGGLPAYCDIKNWGNVR